MKAKFLLALVTLTFSTAALAVEIDTLYVIKSISIDAPASKTWNRIAKFGDLGAWHPAVAKTEITKGNEATKGANRVLTLQDGGKINETLTAYSAADQSMSYIITDGVLPVAAYASTLRVLPNGANKSVVVWESSFKAKAPADDNTAVTTINSVYDGGLANLKKLVE